MQGQQLNLVAVVFLFPLLHHVPQHQLGDSILDADLVGRALAVVQHALDRLHQVPDVLHPPFGLLRTAGMLVQPFFVFDVGEQLFDDRDWIFREQALAGFVDPVGEPAQPVQAFLGDMGFRAHIPQRLEQADVAGAGIVAELLQCARADFPARHVHHPQEGGIVVRVNHQPQVRHRILDLVLGEERLAAGDAVGNLVGLQLHLQQPGLVVAPVKHCEILEIQAVLQLLVENLGSHPLGFGVFVAATNDADFVTHGVVAPEGFLEHVGVVGNHRVGAAQDPAGGAVVLLQLDDFQAREVFLQLGQVFRPGAAPGVDGLVIITHYGKRRPLGHQLFHQLVLAHVGVLVLIHQHVADFPAPLGQHVRVVPEQLHRQQDQVVKIHRVVGFQVFVVVPVDDGNALLTLVCRLAVGLGGAAHGVFPGRDGHLHIVQLITGLGAGFAQHQVLQQGLGIFGIEDGKAGVITQVGMFLPDHVQAQVVEGRDNQPPGFAPVHNAPDPLFHFPGGLVGKGDGGNVPARDAQFFNQMGDLAGDHAGLATAGARQHQQGAVGVANRFALSGVELVHDKDARE